ncbi:MAG: metalloregulator ArsR/SmtB family transcription factor [Thermaerobacter sp.]|nr:metalloregulator ArsR/SmtB family transcription factor [Thermaerobacter sp.]
METLVGLSAVCRALGDPTRLEMLGLLRRRDICVCEFVALFGLSQPAVSQHLHRLKEAGLVRDRRQGMWVFYHLVEDLPPPAAAALTALPRPLPREERLAALARDECAAPARTSGRGERRPGNSLA